MGVHDGEGRHMTKTYADLADLPEDKRINVIGNAAMKGQRVAFIVDDEPEKPLRYIKKLTTLFPQVGVLEMHPGPGANVITVIVERLPLTAPRPTGAHP